MATRVALTLRERNDEVLSLTITPDDPTDSLLGVLSLRVYLKDDDCQDDDALGVLVLTSADPNEVTILSQTAGQITALAYIPASALVGSYDRVWRCDAHAATTHRTALYGPVTVTPL